MSGHVICMAKVVTIEEASNNRRLWFLLPPSMARFVFEKGYIGVDGISLTVGDVRPAGAGEGVEFSVNLIPETLSRTMTLMPGDLIATGTCAGVGIGFKPPKFLKKGDSVAITIEPISSAIWSARARIAPAAEPSLPRSGTATAAKPGRSSSSCAAYPRRRMPASVSP